MAPVIRQPLCATPRVQQADAGSQQLCALRITRSFTWFSTSTARQITWNTALSTLGCLADDECHARDAGLLWVLMWWNPRFFFRFSIWTYLFNSIRMSQVHDSLSSKHSRTRLSRALDWGFAEPCCFACSSFSWESDPLSRDQGLTMSGYLMVDHRINFPGWF